MCQGYIQDVYNNLYPECNTLGTEICKKFTIQKENINY